MRCICGYSFVPYPGTDAAERFDDNYALIRNKEYRQFLESEVKALDAKDECSRLKALAHSSQYVGNALICPECTRLCLVAPGGGPASFYQLEATEED